MSSTEGPRRSGRRRQPPSPPGSSPKLAPSSSPSPKQAQPPAPASKAPRMGPVKPTMGLAEENPQAMWDDFAAMGYTPLEVKAYKLVKESEVDSATQIRHKTRGAAMMARELKLDAFMKKQNRRYGLKKQGVGSPKGKKAARTQVHLTSKPGKWVLFDPVRGYPPTLENEPPAAFERWSKYKPGNTKVVGYNTASFAVTLRSTPASFEDHEVQYLKCGPKLVKMTPAATDKADSVMGDP